MPCPTLLYGDLSALLTFNPCCVLSLPGDIAETVIIKLTGLFCFWAYLQGHRETYFYEVRSGPSIIHSIEASITHRKIIVILFLKNLFTAQDAKCFYYRLDAFSKKPRFNYLGSIHTLLCLQNAFRYQS
jgi:hypothetical protein